MNNKAASAVSPFSPPPPMRMEAYLDSITKGRVEKRNLLPTITELEAALTLIEARPTPAERFALLAALEDRYMQFGTSKGYVSLPDTPDDKDRANVLAQFILEEILHLKPASAQAKVVDAFKDKLKEVVLAALTTPCKISLAFLKLLYDLCSAKSPEDVEKILIGFTYLGLGEFVRKNWQGGLRAAMKFASVRPVVRNRLIKLIAARLSWINIYLQRFAWASPILLAIDIFLTSEDTATDDQEWRLTFLVQHARIVNSRDYLYTRLVRSCDDSEWQFRTPPVDLLTGVIQKMR